MSPGWAGTQAGRQEDSAVATTMASNVNQLEAP